MRPKYKTCSKTPWRLAGCWLQQFCRSRRQHSVGPAAEAADIFCHRSKYFYIMPYSDYWAHFPYLRFINICTFVDTKMHNILIRIQVSDVPSVVLALGWHGRLLDYLIKSLLMWILTCWHYSHGLGSSEKNNIYVISSFPSHWKIIRCRVDIRYLQKYSLRTISVYSTCKKTIINTFAVTGSDILWWPGARSSPATRLMTPSPSSRSTEEWSTERTSRV